MKRMILIFLLGMFAITHVKSQVQPIPPSGDVIIVYFGEGNKTGELYFDEDTQYFISGWISYPAPYNDLYYMLPVNSVSGSLIGEPIELEEPEDCEECPIPLPSLPSFSHFEGTIYYGTGSEWGDLVLHSGNNGVLQVSN